MLVTMTRSCQMCLLEGGADSAFEGAEGAPGGHDECSSGGHARGCASCCDLLRC